MVAALGAGADGVKGATRSRSSGRGDAATAGPAPRAPRTDCGNVAALGIMPPGLGAPGAIGLHDRPQRATPGAPGRPRPGRERRATDVGLTPDHRDQAIPAQARARLDGGRDRGGGPRHMAIDMLRALSPARVVALDIGDDKPRSRRRWATHDAFPSDGPPLTWSGPRRRQGGRGGLRLRRDRGDGRAGRTMVRPMADIVLVGVATPRSGRPVRRSRSTNVRGPYWGSRGELSRSSTSRAVERSTSRRSAPRSRMGRRPTSGRTRDPPRPVR